MKYLLDLIAKIPTKIWFLIIFGLVTIMVFGGWPWYINIGLFIGTGVIAIGLFIYFGINTID